MLSLLLLGFLIGMKHALEADHVAAVASLAAQSRSMRQTVRQGMTWGAGHTLALFAFGSIVVVLDAPVPEAFARWLELAVGVMLVLLGADVLRRMLRDRVHYHFHEHGDEVHFHAHSHRGERGHDPASHQHTHPRGFPIRALVIGLVHGMAGSAALIMLTVSTVTSPWLGLLYIALFGLGSIAGMAALSAVIAIPLSYSARRLTWLHNGTKAAVGAGTMALGVGVVLRLA